MSELDAEITRWTREVLAVIPTCLKILKRSFAKVMDRTPQSEVVNETAPDFFDTGEQKEGAAAFLETRPPNFQRWR